MFTTRLTVNNPTGFHARPASELTKLCKQYISDITITYQEHTFDPRSILNLLSAGIGPGTDITLSVTGRDEEDAGNAIADFINNLKE